MTTMSDTRAVPQFHRGDRLRKARELAGIGSEEMAERMGVSRFTVRNWEKNGTMKRHAIAQWAVITDVSADWLESGMDTALEGRTASTRCYVHRPQRTLRSRAILPRLPTLLLAGAGI